MIRFNIGDLITPKPVFESKDIYILMKIHNRKNVTGNILGDCYNVTKECFVTELLLDCFQKY